MDRSNLDALVTVPLFAALPSPVLERLKSHSFVQSQPADAVLFEQGQAAQFLHVILAGSVALVGSSPSVEQVDGTNFGAPPDEPTLGRPTIEREAIIEFFGAGDVVTIAAVLLNLPYMMSARVIAPSRIILIPAQLVRDCLNTEPAFARAAALMLAKHWRLLSRQLKDQKLRSGTQRLGTYLLTLCNGRTSGFAEIALPLDRKTLASWLGLSAETLSRSLAQLKPLGVDISGRHAKIKDIAGLRTFCLEDDLR